MAEAKKMTSGERYMTQREQRIMDAALRRSLKILPDPELLRLKRLLVKVVMPLEVIRMSGWDRNFTQELRDAVEEAVVEIREALKSDD